MCPIYAIYAPYMAHILSARARARARAPGPRVALGPPALFKIGDYAQRLFARAQLEFCSIFKE